MDNDDKVVSLSGAPIYRYTEGEKPWQSPRGEVCLEAISAHIERHIGDVAMVFHELLSDTVHVDIHHVEPTAQRPMHTLITSGMSDLPMPVPEGGDSPPYMELMVTLPQSWQVSEAAFKHEVWYWPLRQLKFLARFPHKFDTWLGLGHTLPNGDPAEPYAENTQLDSILLLPSLHVPDGFYELVISPEKTIHFLSLVPLYRQEMAYKLAKGTDALLEKFERHDITDVIDIQRKNVAKKRFGLF